MAQRQITNCGDCAYVKKDGNKMWCPFHDVAVSNKLVCDDFLNEYDSPQWQSLLEGMGDKNISPNTIPQFTISDVVAYICSGTIAVLGALMMLIVLVFEV